MLPGDPVTPSLVDEQTEAELDREDDGFRFSKVQFIDVEKLLHHAGGARGPDGEPPRLVDFDRAHAAAYRVIANSGRDHDALVECREQI